MRIGLDFDNTLARYDNVFACEAKKENIVSKEWQGTKKQLRETLRSLERGDHLWQQLQGRVYGPMMPKAEIFPGVKEALSDRTSKSPERFAFQNGTFTKSPPSVAFSSAKGCTTPLAKKASRAVVCSITYGAKTSGTIMSDLKVAINFPR